MIRRICHDGYNRHRPGVPVIVSNAKGEIIFSRDGIGGQTHRKRTTMKAETILIAPATRRGALALHGKVK